jgi:hypothetical protein
MKTITGAIGSYFRGLDKRVLALSTLLMALAIFINYSCGMNRVIGTYGDARQMLCRFGIYFLLFSSAYSFVWLLKGNNCFVHKRFVALLVLAPALFAWKASANLHFPLHVDPVQDAYWNHVLYWPFKLLVVTLSLTLTWRVFDRDQPFYGLSVRALRLRPYFIMLLLMVPLIAAASTQPDFLQMYPRIRNIGFMGTASDGWHRLLYELSYGSDFLTIELFFRGFLVLAFARYAGKDAILPMALFYCAIHFGKPLGECIGAYFGAMILGAVIYQTRSLVGGLIVHLGIAWLMELGGWIGNGMQI